MRAVRRSEYKRRRFISLGVGKCRFSVAIGLPGTGQIKGREALRKVHLAFEAGLTDFDIAVNGSHGKRDFPFGLARGG